VKTERKVDARQIELPMYVRVLEEIGKPIVFNICMLGAVLGLTELISETSVEKVLTRRIPSGFLDINRKALKLGMALVQESVAA